MENQVVSKDRVADFGEVLTGQREVNAMLDLVKQETERIDYRCLSVAYFLCILCLFVVKYLFYFLFSSIFFTFDW